MFAQFKKKTTLKDIENQLLQLTGKNEEQLINFYVQVFSHLTAKDIMIEEQKLQLWDVDEDTSLIAKHHFSKTFEKYPFILLYMGQTDNIVGYITISELLNFFSKQNMLPLKSYKKDVAFVSPWMHMLSLFSLLHKSKGNLAVVVNEYGGMEGIVTKDQVTSAFINIVHEGYQNKGNLPFVLPFENKILFTNGDIQMEQFQRYIKKTLPADYDKTLNEWLHDTELLLMPMEYLSFQDLGFSIKILKMTGDFIQLLRIDYI